MLRRGSRGEEVEALQRLLLAKGFNPGPIDGVFGPKTEAAVKRFQERNKLQVDGIAGPKTMGAFAPPAAASASPKLGRKGSAATGKAKEPAARPGAAKKGPATPPSRSRQTGP